MWNTNRYSSFGDERSELIRWLKGKRQDILVLYCNNARMVQDLHRIIFNDRPYEKLSKEQRGKEAIRKKANLEYFTGFEAEKFCKENNVKLEQLAKGRKDNSGQYYKLFILMTTKTYEDLKLRKELEVK